MPFALCSPSKRVPLWREEISLAPHQQLPAPPLRTYFREICLSFSHFHPAQKSMFPFHRHPHCADNTPGTSAPPSHSASGGNSGTTIMEGSRWIKYAGIIHHGAVYCTPGPRQARFCSPAPGAHILHTPESFSDNVSGA